MRKVKTSIVAEKRGRRPAGLGPAREETGPAGPSRSEGQCVLSRERTRRRFCGQCNCEFLPLTDQILPVAAAMRGSGCRSTSNYFSSWKRLHAFYGHELSSRIVYLLARASRLSRRGLGPPSRARSFNVFLALWEQPRECVLMRSQGDPSQPRFRGFCGPKS